MQHCRWLWMLATSHAGCTMQDISQIRNNWSGQTHGDNFRLFLRALWIQNPLYFSFPFSNICDVTIKLISMTGVDHHAVSISFLKPKKKISSEISWPGQENVASALLCKSTDPTVVHNTLFLLHHVQLYFCLGRIPQPLVTHWTLLGWQC